MHQLNQKGTQLITSSMKFASRLLSGRFSHPKFWCPAKIVTLLRVKQNSRFPFCFHGNMKPWMWHNLLLLSGTFPGMTFTVYCCGLFCPVNHLGDRGNSAAQDDHNVVPQPFYWTPKLAANRALDVGHFTILPGLMRKVADLYLEEFVCCRCPKWAKSCIKNHWRRSVWKQCLHWVCNSFERQTEQRRAQEWLSSEGSEAAVEQAWMALIDFVSSHPESCREIDTACTASSAVRVWSKHRWLPQLSEFPLKHAQCTGPNIGVRQSLIALLFQPSLQELSFVGMGFHSNCCRAFCSAHTECSCCDLKLTPLVFRHIGRRRETKRQLGTNTSTVARYWFWH